MGKKTIGATQCAAFLPTGERTPAAIPGNGKARAGQGSVATLFSIDPESSVPCSQTGAGFCKFPSEAKLPSVASGFHVPERRGD